MEYPLKFGKYDVFANMKWLQVEVEKKQQQQYMEYRLKLYQQRRDRGGVRLGTRLFRRVIPAVSLFPCDIRPRGCLRTHEHVRFAAVLHCCAAACCTSRGLLPVLLTLAREEDRALS